MPGDLVFIIGGVLPFLWMAFQGLMHHRQGRTVDELPVERLFVEEAPDEQGRDRLPEVSR